jgi:hypothetical protein
MPWASPARISSASASLVVASTPDEGIEGVPVELMVSAVNHPLPHFLPRARMPLPRRTGKTWGGERKGQPPSRSLAMS